MDWKTTWMAYGLHLQQCWNKTNFETEIRESELFFFFFFFRFNFIFISLGIPKSDVSFNSLFGTVYQECTISCDNGVNSHGSRKIALNNNHQPNRTLSPLMTYHTFPNPRDLFNFSQLPSKSIYQNLIFIHYTNPHLG